MITLDFETYSEAGYTPNTWEKLEGASGKGIVAVGAAVYAEHPTTEVLMFSYDLHDGAGERVWVKGLPAPSDLIEAIRSGDLIEAHNSGFERLIWKHVLTDRMGWPRVPFESWRCSASKCRASGLPGALGKAAEALKLAQDKQKDKAGRALITRFSCPPKVAVDQDLPRASQFLEYCVQDVRTERAVSDQTPPLSDTELKVWQLDQRINNRGVYIDPRGLSLCMGLVRGFQERGAERARALTEGAIESMNSGKQVLTWLSENGLALPNLQAHTITGALERDDLDPVVREVLQIREQLAGTAVNKLFAMDRLRSKDGRVRETAVYHGAHTGRWAGRGIQPQNFPSRVACDDVDEALDRMGRGEVALDEAPELVKGCLRGLICAEKGNDLISSDYSAIEAVVLAWLAGEAWRNEVFNTHGMIYEMSASKAFGVPFEEFKRHKATTGEHHPLRKKGKVAELALGYNGSKGAWRAMDPKSELSDDEILQNVYAWRDASPAIVAFWKDLERAFFNAIQYGALSSVGPQKLVVIKNPDYDAVNVILPSGRWLWYRGARVEKVQKPWGASNAVTYWGVDPKTGNWVKHNTYGGKLTENVTQAVARDFLAEAMLRLEGAGYPVVMHVHDEVVCEVREGFGSVEGLEAIMSERPSWAKDCPVKAGGGWRGKRFRKD